MTDELLVQCQNALPGQVTRTEERDGLMAVHLGALLETDPTPAMWNAVYHLARRFGFHPGKTRWERGGVAERGLHCGAFVLGPWHERTN